MRTYNLPLGRNPNQSENGCAHGMNSSRRKPANRRCMSWGWHRIRPCSKITRPQRRLTSWSTWLRNRSQEIRFKSKQQEQCHLFEASVVEEEAKFQVEVTQRRLQHRKQINEESQKSLAIQVVGKMVGNAMPPIILQLSSGLLATEDVTVPVPIPIYQSPILVQSMRMHQNSSGDPLQHNRQSSQTAWAPSVTSPTSTSILVAPRTPALGPSQKHSHLQFLQVMLQTVITMHCNLVSKGNLIWLPKWRLLCLSNGHDNLMASLPLQSV